MTANKKSIENIINPLGVLLVNYTGNTMLFIEAILTWLSKLWSWYSIRIFNRKWEYLAMVLFLSALFQHSSNYTNFDEIMCEILQWGYILGILGFWFTVNIKVK